MTTTPTTEEIRDGWAHCEWDVNTEAEESPRRALFDAWLTEHDRAVAEAAWEQGRESIGADMLTPLRADGTRTPTPNPFRSVPKENT